MRRDAADSGRTALTRRFGQDSSRSLKMRQRWVIGNKATPASRHSIMMHGAVSATEPAFMQLD